MQKVQRDAMILRYYVRVACARIQKGIIFTND